MEGIDEKRLQNQFGAFCTKVLKNEANNIHRENARMLEREKSVDSLTDEELEQLAVQDRYFAGEHIFTVQGLPIVVSGDVLADAIKQLSDIKKEIILLYYFLNMSDREISEQQYVSRQAVTKRRHTAIKELYEYLAKEDVEWQDI